MSPMHGRMDLDWQDLRFFLAVQRAGSLTAAAARLGVNQSTVSRRLAALESAIGARLFERTLGGLRPTATAERNAPAAERLEAEALAIGRVLSGAESRVEGVVRLTTAEGLGIHLLAPALRELHRAHPGLQVELLLDSKSLSLSRCPGPSIPGHYPECTISLRRPRTRGSSRCGSPPRSGPPMHLPGDLLVGQVRLLRNDGAHRRFLLFRVPFGSDSAVREDREQLLVARHELYAEVLGEHHQLPQPVCRMCETVTLHAGRRPASTRATMLSHGVPRPPRSAHAC